MYRSRSFDLVHRTKEYENNKYPRPKGSLGNDLHALAKDRAIKTDPDENKRRRAIRLVRNYSQSWGFTLQTYGIRNKRTREVEVMSYVDYVEIKGPAWIAGMRRGDVILSVNGESVEDATHKEVVSRIQRSRNDLRLVVLFEDCCKKVELHDRYIKLKKLLSMKMKELRQLESEEKSISQRIPLSRTDTFRQSVCSSVSSEYDIYSEITSPSLFENIPANQFVFRENLNQSVSDISTGSSTPDTSFNTSFASANGPETRNGDNSSSSSTEVERLPELGKGVVKRVQEIREEEEEQLPQKGCQVGDKESSENGRVDERGEEDARGFLHSDHSDRSQTSDSGFVQMYNLTRCAQCISSVSHCTHTSLEPNKSFVSDSGGSMTNLALNSGSEIMKVSSNRGHPRVGQRDIIKGAKLSVQGGHNPDKFKAFYIESDSEDSSLNGDLNRSRLGQMSFSSGHSVSVSDISSVSGVSSISCLSSNSDTSKDGACSVYSGNPLYNTTAGITEEKNIFDDVNGDGDLAQEAESQLEKLNDNQEKVDTCDGSSSLDVICSSSDGKSISINSNQAPAVSLLEKSSISSSLSDILENAQMDEIKVNNKPDETLASAQNSVDIPSNEVSENTQSDQKMINTNIDPGIITAQSDSKDLNSKFDNAAGDALSEQKPADTQVKSTSVETLIPANTFVDPVYTLMTEVSHENPHNPLSDATHVKTESNQTSVCNELKENPTASVSVSQLPKKRLIHGILVNETSHSTRL